jgi:hypothetical protein
MMCGVVTELVLLEDVYDGVSVAPAPAAPVVRVLLPSLAESFPIAPENDDVA